MKPAAIAVSASLLTLALALCLPHGLYWLGLRGLPETLPEARRSYPDALRTLYWTAELGATGPLRVQPRSPLGTLAELLSEPASRRPPADRVLVQRAAHLMHRELSAPERGRHLGEASLAIRLSRERDARQLLDYLLDGSYFGLDPDGQPIGDIGTAAQRYFGRPIEALAANETLALLTLARGSLYEPACNGERFARRYRSLSARAGLASTGQPPPGMRIGACTRR